jgi:hypothetical protein
MIIHAHCKLYRLLFNCLVHNIEIYHACKCLLAREICPVSQPVFFGKYHLQAWYISIIPPNMWLSLPEDNS